MTGTFLPIELTGNQDFSLDVARRALTICYIDWLHPASRGRELSAHLITGMSATLWRSRW